MKKTAMKLISVVAILALSITTLLLSFSVSADVKQPGDVFWWAQGGTWVTNDNNSLSCTVLDEHNQSIIVHERSLYGEEASLGYNKNVVLSAEVLVPPSDSEGKAMLFVRNENVKNPYEAKLLLVIGKDSVITYEKKPGLTPIGTTATNVTAGEYAKIVFTLEDTKISLNVNGNEIYKDVAVAEASAYDWLGVGSEKYLATFKNIVVKSGSVNNSYFTVLPPVVDVDPEYPTATPISAKDAAIDFTNEDFNVPENASIKQTDNGLQINNKNYSVIATQKVDPTNFIVEFSYDKLSSNNGFFCMALSEYPDAYPREGGPGIYNFLWENAKGFNTHINTTEEQTSNLPSGCGEATLLHPFSMADDINPMIGTHKFQVVYKNDKWYVTFDEETVVLNTTLTPEELFPNGAYFVVSSNAQDIQYTIKNITAPKKVTIIDNNNQETNDKTNTDKKDNPETGEATSIIGLLVTTLAGSVLLISNKKRKH